MTGNLRKVCIVAARRTPVAPRHGAFAKTEIAGLAAPVLTALLNDAGVAKNAVDHVILGNALYGGGNPARVAALAAGLDCSIPAITIDSQCCAGLDAIQFGASLIASGQAEAVIAGGVESYSRSPIRVRRPREPADASEPYLRPPFTPWPDADPDMVEAAAALAAEMNIPRQLQEAFAIGSHRKAIAASQVSRDNELVSVSDLHTDAFARNLSQRICERLPVLAGNAATGLTSATVAVEADAAAAVLLVSEKRLAEIAVSSRPLCFLGGRSGGGDPVRPGLAPIGVAQALLHQHNIKAPELAAVEIMEAFAVQAMAFVDALQLRPNSINRGGGALARGHPIGASGAILAVRLFHELQTSEKGAHGLAAIAAAGGLGSALLLQV
ncbi:MAG: thiolase family protein [Hyphomicrobiales bacterium]|nr:thiolase family protein [Hyphomicrobiales bacterium]